MVASLAGRIYQHPNLWPLYEARKAEWLRKHPEASAEELERVTRRIARDLRL